MNDDRNPITPEHIRWAYRLFLDREPENDAVLARTAPDTKTLRQTFLQSAEFNLKNPEFGLSIDKWVTVETDLGFRIRVALNEFGVSRAILLGDYEAPTVAFFRNVVKPNARVIDVGANIGFFSLLLARLVGPGGEVLAFEPVKYLYDALEISIAENDFGGWMQAHNCAISDHSGRAMIRHAPGTSNFGGGHLAEQIRDDNHIYEEVATHTLTEFLSDRRCEFLKIDAEGAEFRVLSGGVDLLRRDRPIVVVELFNEQLRRVSNCTATDLIKLMAQLGYQCFEIDNATAGRKLRSYDAPEITNVLFQPA
jgi:FkbM family methyltransferase